MSYVNVPILLANTLEHHHYCQRLQLLLESKEIAGIHLALEIMRGAGVPQNLMTHLTAITLWHSDRFIRRDAKSLLRGLASVELLSVVRRLEKYPNHYTPSEAKTSEHLGWLAAVVGIDIRHLGYMSIRLRNKGGKFCLERKVAATHEILSWLIRDKQLFLANYALSELPAAIGAFPQIEVLNISGNLFSTLPCELSCLTHLKALYYDRTPLSEQAVGFLEQCFPQVMLNIYLDRAAAAHQEGNRAEAMQYIRRCLGISPARAQAAWQQEFAEYIHEIDYPTVRLLMSA